MTETKGTYVNNVEVCVGWDYYQNSYVRKDYEIPLPVTHSFSQIENEFSRKHGKHRAFFASYITEFDCKEETQWWFTIKDSEYELASLKAKRRYEITKAKKFCNAKRISASDYVEELFECYMKAFEAYPEKYRPKEFVFNGFVDLVKNGIRILHIIYMHVFFQKIKN